MAASTKSTTVVFEQFEIPGNVEATFKAKCKKKIHWNVGKMIKRNLVVLPKLFQTICQSRHHPYQSKDF